MGLSRNKVAVPEGAAGSPPFYGVFQDAGPASVVWPMRRGWFPGSCGRAGVEEIVGFAGPWGPCGEWCGYAFGFPDRHPHPFWVRAVFRMPLAGRRGPVGLWVGSGRGAWWFENWIVDASNAGFFVLLALSRFRQASFLESGFEIDRFVIIFYSVMICRLAFEAIIRVFRGVCRPEGRMVDALADSTDEGRLRMR